MSVTPEPVDVLRVIYGVRATGSLVVTICPTEWDWFLEFPTVATSRSIAVSKLGRFQAWTKVSRDLSQTSGRLGCVQNIISAEPSPIEHRKRAAWQREPSIHCYDR